tara:strand:+ start:914 stop:1198 length:285 start_codon:yes stop_codon:yes gene_type:complete
MKQKVTVTLKRFYFKEVEMEIDNELIKGMSHEEIATYLMEEHPYDTEDELFDKAELDDLEIDLTLGSFEGGVIREDTDRYDIYENDKQIYGGHL